MSLDQMRDPNASLKAGIRFNFIYLLFNHDQAFLRSTKNAEINFIDGVSI